MKLSNNLLFKCYTKLLILDINDIQQQRKVSTPLLDKGYFIAGKLPEFAAPDYEKRMRFPGLLLFSQNSTFQRFFGGFYILETL